MLSIKTLISLLTISMATAAPYSTCHLPKVVNAIAVLNGESITGNISFTQKEGSQVSIHISMSGLLPGSHTSMSLVILPKDVRLLEVILILSIRLMVLQLLKKDMLETWET